MPASRLYSNFIDRLPAYVLICRHLASFFPGRKYPQILHGTVCRKYLEIKDTHPLYEGMCRTFCQRFSEREIGMEQLANSASRGN
jgi:hypothetical protein